ncbi:MAG: hypothetical protein PHO12_02965 [Bacteroidales bacterium]|nr:hypothetical protein [Bacteroidales bacterium]MDD4684713.1 hypothetical protein [Bacteroidales bacterium]
MIREKFYRSGYFNDTISSAILFVIAYLFVLYVSLFSTAFISFTNQITIPMEIDKIDFERASSSSDAVWESAENVFIIFSFSPLVVFILSLLAVIATKKTQNNTLGALLFWIIFHCIMRLFGDFLFGHVFNLWGPNLVSDFMGITHPNFYPKLILVVISFIGILSIPLLLLPLITPFFNPIGNKADEGVKINFIYPSIIGVAFLFLWICPSFYINEVSILITSIISLLVFSNYVVKKYKFISLSGEYVANDRFNIKFGYILLIITSIILITIKIILSNGIMLRSSGYRRDQLDGIFYTSLIGVLFLVFLSFIIYLVCSRRNEREKHNQEVIATLESIEQEKMDISMLEGTKWSGIADSAKKAQSLSSHKDEE